MERVMATNASLSTDPKDFITFARNDGRHREFEQKRAAVDSWHDNNKSETIPIIKQLYGPSGIPRTWDEDQFVNQVLRGPISETYFLNRTERLQEQVNGFLTPQLECLVNDTPFIPFRGTNSENIVFPYDQGPALFKYFKGAKNCLFFSDAVDTAPKKTKSNSQPYWAPLPGDLGNGHTGFTIQGVDLGFNPNVVRTVAFADFIGDKTAGRVGCKVLIEVGNDQKVFRWYDLANQDTNNRPSVLGDALENARIKMSNKPTGFFIGNEEGALLLADENRRPIAHLCTVVAKILGDISVGIASSAQMRQYYTDLQWRSLYSDSPLDPKPTRFIHNTGDRTSSMEASRLGGDALYTSPMREGSAPFRFIPGESTVARQEVPETFIARIRAVRDEINTRYDALIADLDQDVNKYKVDGEPVQKDKLDILQRYISDLVDRVQRVQQEALTNVDSGIQEIEELVRIEENNDEKIKIARTAYETLNNRKILIMPQAPTISPVRKNGARKSVNSKFIINRELRAEVFLRDDIYRIKTQGPKRARTAGTRRGKRNVKRTLKKVYRMKGGKYDYPTLTAEQKVALAKFEGLVDRIVEGAIRLRGGEEIKDSGSTTVLGNLVPGSRDDVSAFLEAVKSCKFKDEPAYDELLMELLEDELADLVDAEEYKKESIAAYKEIIAFDADVRTPVNTPKRSNSIDSTGSKKSEAVSEGKASIAVSEPPSLPSTIEGTQRALGFQSEGYSQGGRKTRRKRRIF
jgi:hypothetical protein